MVLDVPGSICVCNDNYCFYPVKDAEEIVVSKFLSHGSNREDLKKIYLRS